MNKDCKHCGFSSEDAIEITNNLVEGFWCEKKNVFLYPQSTKYAKVCRHYVCKEK